jgi:galactokinase
VADLAKLQPSGEWTDYIVGVAQQLRRYGCSIQPCNLLIHSTVPDGAGLSSSAALEVSTALAMLADTALDPVDLAQICHRAEVEFVGLPCGIMDQYVSIFGQEGAAIEIDCRTLQSQPVALPTGIEMFAVNTMVKHALSQSAYAERVRECQEAVEFMRERDPHVESLRDVRSGELEPLAAGMNETLMKRARHVIMENERVESFVDAAHRGDLKMMGELFAASHHSLQHDYEVSCEELDFLVDSALAMPGVYGARMTGGGFGGCTVNLLAPAAAPLFRDQIIRCYHSRFGIEPEIYLCQPSRGASENSLVEK